MICNCCRLRTKRKRCKIVSRSFKANMSRCIFCKADSLQSMSTEHIMPESIGNTDHFLPKGIVCDNCNNYFSRELENPILSSGIIQELRSIMEIKTKKGKIPPFPPRSSPNVPTYRLMGRFIGKIGLEVLSQRLHRIPLWESEVVDNKALDSLRVYVRFNEGKEDWGFSFRTLHPANAIFFDGKDHYELLHEYDLLYTSKLELFIIVSIFGVEFALNLGGPEIDGYMEWLEQNNYRSPLYMGKNINI